jgi:hypothetical protein
MRVGVPHPGGVDALPGPAHELVIGEAVRQAREARIPQPLLGPVPPGDGPGRRGAERARA